MRSAGRKSVLLASIAVAIVATSGYVLRPFLASIGWAAVLAYASWPVYRRLRVPFGRFRSWAAGFMTLLLTAAAIVPLVWLSVRAAVELLAIYHAATDATLDSPAAWSARLRELPWIGDWLAEQLSNLAAAPGFTADDFGVWIKDWRGEILGLMGGIGRNLARVFLTLVTLFFFYRDGDAIVRQSRTVVVRLLGSRIEPYLMIVTGMTRAVVYGLLLTAIAQGVVAGIGYAIIGLPAAVLLGALTGLLSVVPVLGTALVWGAVGLRLLAAGSLWKGVFVLAWGFLLVHPTDNVLRPMLISNATRVPFLLVMFGILGGVGAFGLIGAFIGPIVLAVGLGLWRELARPPAAA